MLGNGSTKPSILKAHFASRHRHPTHAHDNHMFLQTNRVRFHATKTLPILWFVSDDTVGLDAFTLAKETAYNRGMSYQT